ncbi:hypothetical protein ACFQ0M_49140 [Kitasatospora aburaviensis]
MCAEEDDEFGPDGASDEGAELPLPEIIEVLVHALNEEGADALTLGRLHPYLIAHNATRWDRWHDKDEHGLLKEIGRTLAAEFGKAGVDLTTKRLDEFEEAPRRPPQRRPRGRRAVQRVTAPNGPPNGRRSAFDRIPIGGAAVAPPITSRSAAVPQTDPDLRKPIQPIGSPTPLKRPRHPCRGRFDTLAAFRRWDPSRPLWPPHNVTTRDRSLPP